MCNIYDIISHFIVLGPSYSTYTHASCGVLIYSTSVVRILQSSVMFIQGVLLFLVVMISI
jgi:hypothetical protein